MTTTAQRIIALLRGYAEQSSTIGDQAHDLGDQVVADTHKVAYRVATKLADEMEKESSVESAFYEAGQQSLAFDQEVVKREVEHLRTMILQWCLDEQSPDIFKRSQQGD